METKHTKGDWNVTSYNDLQYSISTSAHGYDEREISDEEDQANARLIAAAPDMLKALINAHDALKDIINAADNGQPYNAVELEAAFMGYCNDAYKTINKAAPYIEEFKH